MTATNTRWQGKRVGVLLGGLSKEREVSLKSGTAVAQALERRGYAVVRIDIGAEACQQLREEQIDVAFIALHGNYGEDGTIQGVLEYLHIPYTGAGVVGSAVAMDKVLCKHVARDLGIPLAHELVVHMTTATVDTIAQQLPFEFPVVVKPAREGSTIGLRIVRQPAELPSALQVAAASDQKILIEEYVAGAEITVGMLCGEVLPAIEIVPKSGLYDYEAKYTKGLTEYLIPARIPATTLALAGQWTQQLWHECDCRGMARADFIVRPDGTAVFLEINTIPGMTETSLVPKAAAHIDVSFDEVCERVLNDAHVRLRRGQ